MSIKIEVEMKNTTLMNMLKAFSEIGSSPIEYEMFNNEDHIGIVEFGSGIYSDAPNAPRSPITPKRAKMLIVPILPKYLGRVSPETVQQAKENAAKYPDIMAKLGKDYSGVIGFIFKSSVKGQKPVKMVRNSSRKVLQWFVEAFTIYLEHSDGTRRHLAMAVNTVGNKWFNEIVARTPVLTSKLKSGWKKGQTGK